MKKVFSVFVVPLIVFLNGCGTLNDVRPVNGGYTFSLNASKIYNHPLPIVYKSAYKVLEDLKRDGLKIVEEAPDQTYILCSRGITGTTNGEFVGIYFKKIKEKKTGVYSRTVARFGVAYYNFSPLIIHNLDEYLAINFE